MWLAWIHHILQGIQNIFFLQQIRHFFHVVHHIELRPIVLVWNVPERKIYPNYEFWDHVCQRLASFEICVELLMNVILYSKSSEHYAIHKVYNICFLKFHICSTKFRYVESSRKNFFNCYLLTKLEQPFYCLIIIWNYVVMAWAWNSH